jgi:purine-binding chemotaxis protein CheW
MTDAAPDAAKTTRTTQARAEGIAQPFAAGERAAGVLEERARRLAVTGSVPEASAGETVPVLLCRVRDERYAVELGVLDAVRAAAGLMPVPCTPPFVAGILNVRGEIVSVIDLAAALGQEGGAAAESASVLLLQLPETALGHDGAIGDGAAGRHADVGETVRLGLLVDEVLGVQTLTTSDLIAPLSGRDYARGVTGTATVLLDAQRLLAGGHFQVLEDVA